MTGTLEHFNTPDHPSSEPKKNSLAQQVLLGIGDDLLFIQKAVFVAVVALEFGIDALHHLLRLQAPSPTSRAALPTAPRHLLLLVRHFAAVGALHQDGILP